MERSGLARRGRGPWPPVVCLVVVHFLQALPPGAAAGAGVDRFTGTWTNDPPNGGHPRRGQQDAAEHVSGVVPRYSRDTAIMTGSTTAAVTAAHRNARDPACQSSTAIARKRQRTPATCPDGKLAVGGRCGFSGCTSGRARLTTVDEARNSVTSPAITTTRKMTGRHLAPFTEPHPNQLYEPTAHETVGWSAARHPAAACPPPRPRSQASATTTG